MKDFSLSIFESSFSPSFATIAGRKEGNEKKELYAKKVLKSVYESVIYKEDYEVDAGESFAERFAESVITTKPGAVDSICKIALVDSKCLNLDDEMVEECAKDAAETLLKINFEDVTLQLGEIERVSEHKNCNLNFAIETFPLLETYNYLKNINVDESGSIKNALIENLTELQFMKTAIKLTTFKNIMENLGVATNEKGMKDLVEEALETMLLNNSK